MWEDKAGEGGWDSGVLILILNTEEGKHWLKWTEQETQASSWKDLRQMKFVYNLELLHNAEIYILNIDYFKLAKKKYHF